MILSKGLWLKQELLFLKIIVIKVSLYLLLQCEIFCHFIYLIGINELIVERYYTSPEAIAIYFDINIASSAILAQFIKIHGPLRLL